MTALVHHRRDTTVTPVVDQRPTTGTVTTNGPSSTSTDRRTEIRAGIRSMLPWLVGVAPFGMVVSGATTAVVVLSVLVLNTRLLLYGSSIAPHWRGTSRWFRAVAAYLLIDPSFAVGMNGYRQRPTGHAYYIAAGMTLWVAWHAAMFAGVAVGVGLERRTP